MNELSEIQIHRKLVTNQIKREIAEATNLIRKEMLMRTSILESRLHELEKSVNIITNRLMDLSLYENKLILELNKIKNPLHKDVK